jgi:hypothetical protein
MTFHLATEIGDVLAAALVGPAEAAPAGTGEGRVAA